jgi:hypothetical protein
VTKKVVGVFVRFRARKFIEDKPENFQLIKLMAEEGNIKDIVLESMTSKTINL